MIPTEEMVQDCRNQAAGIPMAYVDRLSFVGRNRKIKKEPEIRLPIFKVPKRMEEYVADNNWKGIWKALQKEPLVAASLIAYTLVGLSRDAGAAVSHFIRRFDPELPMPGRLIGVKRDRDATIAEVLVPIRGGGSEVITVKTKGALDRNHSVGNAVDLYQRKAKDGQLYYRIRQPFVTSAYNTRAESFDYIDAKEIASVVRAQYDDLDFCGHWEKIPEATDFIAERFPVFPKRKCTFYRHEKTGDGILVFRGTNPLSLADHAVNLATLRGITLPQYKYAPEVAKMVCARYCERMIVAGHSKGGGIAQYVSAATGMRAVCFNSVGLPESLVRSAKETSGAPPGMVDHFLVRYDWVSNVAGIYHADSMSITDPFAPEKQKFLAKKDDVHFLDSAYQRMRFLALHSISTVVGCLDDDPHLLCNTFDNSEHPIDKRVVRVRDIISEPTSLAGRTSLKRNHKKQHTRQADNASTSL